jgi:tRNA(Ile)-lysidine synthase
MNTDFKQILIEKCQIDFNTPVILGISGGVDSACLLNLFSKIELPLIIAHYHHGLRKSADDDAKFVELLAKNYQIPFEIGSGKVKEIAEIRGLTIEEAARNCRYQFLFEIADKYSAQAVAVAHNADDQVESVIMHLLRGSGLSGLKGMDYKMINDLFHPSIPIIRPLINVWRSEIESYVIQNKLDFCEDPTNLDKKYNRNKIRHEIIPFLDQAYPGLKNRIWNMADVVRYDDQILDEKVNELFLNICDISNSNSNLIGFETDKFLDTHISLQRRLIRRGLFSIDIKIRDIGYQVIERAIKFIHENESGKIDLVNNLILETTKQKFYIFSKGTNWCKTYFPQMNINEEICILKIGNYKFGNNWVLNVEILKNLDKFDFPSNDQYSAWLDFDAIGGFPLILGSRQIGDRFTPLGIEKGSIKLNKFFINEKLAKSARDQWPLIRNSTIELVWVPGYRPANKYKITENSTNILKLHLEKDG